LNIIYSQPKVKSKPFWDSDALKACPFCRQIATRNNEYYLLYVSYIANETQPNNQFLFRLACKSCFESFCRPCGPVGVYDCLTDYIKTELGSAFPECDPVITSLGEVCVNSESFTNRTVSAYERIRSMVSSHMTDWIPGAIGSLVETMSGIMVPGAHQTVGRKSLIVSPKVFERFHGDVCCVCKKNPSEVRESDPNSSLLKFLRCGGCSDVQYCSYECQKDHWKEHQKDCHSKTVGECSGCKQNKLKVRACAGCLDAKYCSNECQKAHWKKHKPLCTWKKNANSKSK